MRLSRLEIQSGKSRNQAIESFALINKKEAQKQKKLVEMEEKESQLQTIIRKNEERAKLTHEAAAVAPEDIAKFKKAEANLAQNGIALSDVETIDRLLLNIRETGNNPEKVVDLVKRVGSLTKAQTNLKSENAKSEALKAQNAIAEQSLSQKNRQIQDADEEIQLRDNTIADQDRQMATQNSSLRYQEANLKRITNLTKAAIVQAGRIVGMSELQVAQLQLNAQLDLLETTICKQITEMTRKQAEAVILRYITP